MLRHCRTAGRSQQRGAHLVRLPRQRQGSAETGAPLYRRLRAETQGAVLFRLGDLYADTFVYSKGDHKGETGVSLKAHLLHIGLIKIDGEEVYRAEREADSQPAPATPPTEPVAQF